MVSVHLSKGVLLVTAVVPWRSVMKPTVTHRQLAVSAWPRRHLTVLVALCAVLLAGCASSGSTGTSTSGSATSVPLAQGSLGVSSAPAGKNSGSAGVSSATGTPVKAPVLASGARLAGVEPKLTKSATLEVQVKNIDSAAATVRTIAAGLAAQVLNEQIGTGSPGGPIPLATKPEVTGGFGTLTVSVPAASLETALDQLSRVGTVLARTLSTQDVTATYIDTASRLQTMRASVERVRALMAQAKDLGQVVALEGELSAREADLESLESQLGALTTSIDRSSVTVSLSTPGTPDVPATGFVAGLRSGWDAFMTSVAELLTVIGTAAPFAVFLALVAAPIAWSLRRRGSGPAAAGPTS